MNYLVAMSKYKQGKKRTNGVVVEYDKNELRNEKLLELYSITMVKEVLGGSFVIKMV